MRWIIRGTYAGRTEEVDSFETRTEAIATLREYRLAFGANWFFRVATAQPPGAEERKMKTTTCNCGELTGERCESDCPEAELIELRYVAASDLGSVAALGGQSRGYERAIRVDPLCADILADCPEVSAATEVR